MSDDIKFLKDLQQELLTQESEAGIVDERVGFVSYKEIEDAVNSVYEKK